MKFGIIVLFWNEWELLSCQLLPNLEYMGFKKDQVVFIDGFFDQMARWEKPRPSDDGSRAVIQKAGYELIDGGTDTILNLCNLRYEIAGKKGWDAMLWIDADEYITGDVPKFKEKLKLLLEKYPNTERIRVAFKDWNKIYDYNNTPQLLLHPENCRQKITHTLYYDQKLNKTIPAKEEIMDITINHDDSLRPPSKDKILNAFSIVNGRIEKMRLNKALQDKEPLLDGMRIIRND